MITIYLFMAILLGKDGQAHVITQAFPDEVTCNQEIAEATKTALSVGLTDGSITCHAITIGKLS